MRIIRPDTIAFKAEISEDDLRDRIGREVVEQIGGLDENGKVRPGVNVRVTRGTGRKAGYVIEVTGPMPARLLISPPQHSGDAA